MKKKVMFYLCLICFTIIHFIFEETSFASQYKHKAITNELIAMVAHHADLRNNLIQSIQQASIINPNKETNPAQTLEEYYDFIDWASEALPWTIIGKEGSYSSLFDHIDQGLCYFYFINDQPLATLKHKGYYHNAIQYDEPYRTWLMQFTEQWGKFLSTTASWKPEYYQKFLLDPSFGLQHGWYEDPSHWKTFNDFFSRRLKSASARPIASPNDLSIVVAPADSVPQGVWNIDSKSNIKSNDGVQIKSGIFKSIPHLLGKNSAYRHAFANGTLTHTYLNEGDYHRYHFPVSGIIKEVSLIKADNAAGGLILWDRKAKQYIFKSSIPGWQSIETRGCVIIDTGDYGLVALLPVGMAQISSVNFEKSVNVGKKVKKGDELGYFLFGGSDFIMLFQKNIRLHVTVPKEASGRYKHILVGEPYAVIEK